MSAGRFFRIAGVALALVANVAMAMVGLAHGRAHHDKRVDDHGHSHELVGRDYRVEGTDPQAGDHDHPDLTAVGTKHRVLAIPSAATNLPVARIVGFESIAPSPDPKIRARDRPSQTSPPNLRAPPQQG